MVRKFIYYLCIICNRFVIIAQFLVTLGNIEQGTCGEVVVFPRVVLGV